VLACGKSNDAAPFTPRALRLDPVSMHYVLDAEFDLATWSARVEGKRRPSQFAAAARRTLAAQPKITARDLAEMIGCGKSRAAEFIREAGA